MYSLMVYKRRKQNIHFQVSNVEKAYSTYKNSKNGKIKKTRMCQQVLVQRIQYFIFVWNEGTGETIVVELKQKLLNVSQSTSTQYELLVKGVHIANSIYTTLIT